MDKGCPSAALSLAGKCLLRSRLPQTLGAGKAGTSSVHPAVNPHERHRFKVVTVHALSGQAVLSKVTISCNVSKAGLPFFQRILREAQPFRPDAAGKMTHKAATCCRCVAFGVVG